LNDDSYNSVSYYPVEKKELDAQRTMFNTVEGVGRWAPHRHIQASILVVFDSVERGFMGQKKAWKENTGMKVGEWKTTER
jgi:hypothetical protein